MTKIKYRTKKQLQKISKQILGAFSLTFFPHCFLCPFRANVLRRQRSFCFALLLTKPTEKGVQGKRCSSIDPLALVSGITMPDSEVSKNDEVRVFFDIAISDIRVGRVIFQLFTDHAPKTAENFRALCTGEAGIGTRTEKPLHYQGSIFHRVVKQFMVQGGDFVNGNGTGGESIYGGTFADENLDLKHDRPFLLSMANRGKNTNGSQFFITTVVTDWLDGKHVVFGRVADQASWELVKYIESFGSSPSGTPSAKIVIADSGEL